MHYAPTDFNADSEGIDVYAKATDKLPGAAPRVERTAALPQSERDRSVERAGRSKKLWTAWTYAVGSALLPVYAVLDSRPWDDQVNSWFDTTTLALAAITVLLALVALLRWAARRVFDKSAEPTEVPPDTDQPDRDELIICCSGGGIKSASFCLGALERLDEEGLYRDADRLVGVSGGGYIAAAYAARQNEMLPGEGEVFPARGREVAELRMKTDYLAPSRAARLDLASSISIGIATNVLIMGGVASLLAWLLAEQMFATDQVKDSATNVPNYSWWPACLVPALIVGIGVAMLGLRQLREIRTQRSEPGAGRFAGSGSRELVDERQLWRAFWDDLPARLLIVGLLIAFIYPGVPFVLPRVQGWWEATQDNWAKMENFLSVFNLNMVAAATALLTFLGLVGASRKGIGDPAIGKAQLFLRREVTPRLGLLVAAAGTYALLLWLTSFFLQTEGMRRWYLCAGAVFALVLALMFRSANKTSLFPFYLRRLQYGFFSFARPGESAAPAAGRTSADGDVQQRTAAAGPEDIPTFDQLAQSWKTSGGPELVLCSTANVKDGAILPSGRNGTPFIFSSEFGLTAHGLPGGRHLKPASAYPKVSGGKQPFTVAAASAISGAAISPLAGREDRTIKTYRLLLALANIRLGVWVRNPCWTDDGAWKNMLDAQSRIARLILRVDRQLDRSSPYKVVQEALGNLSIYSSYLYLTDGGHFDNLGLVECLRRKPKRIILLDGSGDPEDKFPAMGIATATARMDLDVDVDFDPAPLVRGTDKYPQRGWTRATGTYVDDAGEKQTIDIDYVKCVLPKDLSWDLESYKLQNPDFPTDTFKYEVYDEFDFEAYRQLGYSLVDDAVRHEWTEPFPRVRRSGILGRLGDLIGIARSKQKARPASNDIA